MDFYFVAAHHFDMGFSECPSPGSFLGAASQRTKRIRRRRLKFSQGRGLNCFRPADLPFPPTR
jgi:hypothetical protein